MIVSHNFFKKAADNMHYMQEMALDLVERAEDQAAPTSNIGSEEEDWEDAVPVASQGDDAGNLPEC